MGRPRKGAAPGFVVTPTTGETAGEPANELDQQTADLLARTADEGKKPPRARITRWNESLRTYATLDHVAADAVDEEWIANEYGGGKYQVYFLGTKGDGTYGYLKGQGKEFVIDDSIPFRGALRTRAQSAPVHNPDGSTAGGTMEALAQNQVIQLIREQNETRGTSMTMLMQIMQQQATQSQQFMQMMVTMMGQKPAGGLGELKDIIGPLLSGVINKKDPIELATQLAALMKGNEGPRESVKDMIETFSSLMEMKGMLTGERPDDVTLLSTVKDLAPQALDVLKSFAARPAAPVPAPGPPRVAPRAVANGPLLPVAPVPAGPAREVAPMPGVEETPAVIADEWSALEGPMAQLIQQARTNKPAHRVAAMVLLFANDEQQATLREVVAQDDVIPTITARFPEFQKYQTWLGDFVDCLRDEFGLVDDDDDDGEPAPDDSPADGDATA